MNWTRIAIVGTAPSWTMTPWTDPGLTILSLNDAYRMPGFQRADAWFDLHPMDHYWHPPEENQPIFAHAVPPGHYARPKTHVEWLGRQMIPVYLHPDHATQCPASATWPHAHAFPKAEIEAAFDRYFTSTPSWMLAHAILQGATDVSIYGIHLSTEHEYIEQRPCFEFLCGRLLGPGRIKVTRADKLRVYETAQGRLTIPEASPVLSSNFQYAFQPRPRQVLEQHKWDVHRFTVKRERTVGRLAHAKWWQVGKLQAELADYEAQLQLAQEVMGRAKEASGKGERH